RHQRGFGKISARQTLYRHGRPVGNLANALAETRRKRGRDTPRERDRDTARERDRDAARKRDGDTARERGGDGRFTNRRKYQAPREVSSATGSDF
ncbi:MAG: hypothetical protein FWD31_10410, partial [Planctomycetaceae bacterium]|nr:hypothetical protein [Planctomycetaceae bacterium]